MTGWTSLPAEIHLRILSYCLRPDLRNCRLISHATKETATEALFRNVHVGQDFASFGKLVKIAKQRHLVRHVSQLTCHLSGWQDSDASHIVIREQSIGMQRTSVYSRTHSPALGDATSNSSATSTRPGCNTGWDGRGDLDVDSCHYDILPTSTAMRLFFEQSERRIRKITLCDCEGVAQTVCLPERSPRARRHSYYRGLLLPALVDFLVALASYNPAIREVESHAISWTGLCDIHNAMQVDSLMLLVRQTDRLHLSVLLDEASRRSENLLLGLRQFAQALVLRLRQLHIELTTYPADDGRLLRLQTLAILLQPTYPQLCKLSLTGVSIHEDDLLNFVTRHTATLTHLQLTDTELWSRHSVRRWAHRRPSSVVRCIWRLGQLGCLKQMQLRGVISDSYSQAWVAAERADSEASSEVDICFRLQIERYITGQGLFPFTGIQELVRADQVEEALASSFEDRVARGFGDDVHSWHETLISTFQDPSWSAPSDLETILWC